MNCDPDNAVVRLCAEAMAIEGDAEAARRLFEQAWEIRRDDYDASIAAHFLARHQSTVEDRVRWNAAAVHHAEAIADGRTDELKASLYLNLADAHLAAGDLSASMAALRSAIANVCSLPEGGYRTFVQRGIDGLEHRLASAARDERKR